MLHLPTSRGTFLLQESNSFLKERLSWKHRMLPQSTMFRVFTVNVIKTATLKVWRTSQTGEQELKVAKNSEGVQTYD